MKFADKFFHASMIFSGSIMFFAAIFNDHIAKLNISVESLLMFMLAFFVLNMSIQHESTPE